MAGRHFRPETIDESRREFLTRSLAVAAGIFGLKLIDVAKSDNEQARGYGSSPYGR